MSTKMNRKREPKHTECSQQVRGVAKSKLACGSQRLLHFRLWCGNRLRVILGKTFPAKRDVALRANERGIFLLLIDLGVQSSTISCCGSDVTSIRSAAGTHGDLQSFCVQRIHR